MKQKILSFAYMIIITAGLLLSVLNFGSKGYASAPTTIWGTITPGTTYLASWWDLSGRYLYTAGGIRYYCVWTESNCCIVDP